MVYTERAAQGIELFSKHTWHGRKGLAHANGSSACHFTYTYDTDIG